MQWLWSNGSGPYVNHSGRMIQLALDFKWCPSCVSTKVNTASPGLWDGHVLIPFVDDTELGEA